MSYKLYLIIYTFLNIYPQQFFNDLFFKLISTIQSKHKCRLCKYVASEPELRENHERRNEIN